MRGTPISRRRPVLRAAGTLSIGAILGFGGELVEATSLGKEGNVGTAGPAPAQAWKKTYANPDHLSNFFHTLIEVSDGDYMLVGRAAVNDAKRHDVWVVKVSPDGTRRWSKTYGGRHGEFVTDVVETNDGDLLLAGYLKTRGDRNWEALLLRISAKGTLRWKRTFGGDYPLGAESITKTPDGGVVLVGGKKFDDERSAQGWMRKLDTDGSIRWSRTYGDSNGDVFRSVTSTDDGKLLACGYTGYTGNRDGNAWLVKTSMDGSEEWEYTYGNEQISTAFSVIETSNDYYLFAGLTIGKNYVGNKPIKGDDGWLVKVDPAGNKKWSLKYGPSLNDRIESVIETRDGDYLFAGHVSQDPGSDRNTDKFWIVKVAPTGEKRWEQFYSWNPRDYAKDVIQTSEGDYVLAGHMTVFDADRTEGQVLKLDVNDPPEASFRVSDDPTVGRPVRFSAAQSTDSDGTIGAYKWDFTGDGSVDARGETVTHTYRQPGRYTPRLTVLDREGKRDTAERVVTVASTPTPTSSPTPSDTSTGRDPASGTATGTSTAATAPGQTLGIGAGAATLAGMVEWWRRRRRE